MARGIALKNYYSWSIFVNEKLSTGLFQLRVSCRLSELSLLL